MLEFGDEEKYFIGLFFDHFDVSVAYVEFDWFKFGKLEDK